jgi:hypothetical protein
MNTFFHHALVGEQSHEVWETASMYWLSLHVALALGAVWILLIGSDPEWLRWGYLFFAVSAVLSMVVVEYAPKAQTLRHNTRHILIYLLVAILWSFLYSI